MKLHELDFDKWEERNIYIDENGCKWYQGSVDLYDDKNMPTMAISDKYSLKMLLNMELTPVPQYTQLDIDMAKALKFEKYAVILRAPHGPIYARQDFTGTCDITVPSFMFKPIKPGQTVSLDDIIGG